MKRVTSYIFYGTLLFLLTPGGVSAGYLDPALETTLGGLAPDETVPVIITLKDTVKLDGFKEKDKGQRRTKLIGALLDKAATTQTHVKELLKAKKAKKVQSFWIFNGLAATVTAATVGELAALDEVESVSLDATINMQTPVTENAALPEWNLDAIHAPGLWSMGYTGSGVVLANMDTGVDSSHPDLAARYRGGSNSWYDPHGEHGTPYDYHGHGTQVMGIMVGGTAGGSAIGVAPGARWIAVKLFNDAGQASYSVIHASFQWLLDPDNNPATDDAPDVVNNSWGYNQLEGQCFTEFTADVEALKAADIGVVFSAGNGGPYDGTSESPANYQASFATGSLDQTLTISTFSSRGPSACTGDIYPELVAPGQNIYTADRGDSYASVAGTSFAAPHVAGAMGLLLSIDSTRSIADIESAVTAAAVDLGTSGGDNDYGFGLLDVVGAASWLAQNQPQCIEEIKHDGIDQDCNGYDLTIDITNALYTSASQTLTVEATSDLGADANLELIGYGPMKWNRKKNLWSVNIGSVPNDPGMVTVRGIEGEESMLTTVSQGGGSGGGNGGGKGRK